MGVLHEGPAEMIRFRVLGRLHIQMRHVPHVLSCALRAMHVNLLQDLLTTLFAVYLLKIRSFFQDVLPHDL